MAPLPAKPLDLWLGGRAPVGMRRLGRLADGWLGQPGHPGRGGRLPGPDRAGRRHAGREIEADHYGTNLAVAPDGCLIESELAKALARTHRRRADLDPERLVCRGWAAAREELRRFTDAGLTKFVVRPAVPVRSRREFLDQFAAELLPLQT